MFFVDTDDYENSRYDIELNSKINQFCIEHNFHIVWFCKGVEEVFIGKRINNHEKVNCAKKFVASKSISSINENRLNKKDVTRNTSNILYVLDKLLERKKK